jgi:hypothetical protein
VKPAYAAPITSAVTKVTNWYSQPARALLSTSKTVAKKVAPKAATKVASYAASGPAAALAIGLAAQHGYTRIPGVNQASWIDAGYTILRPYDMWTEDQKKVSDRKRGVFNEIGAILLGTAIPSTIVDITKTIKTGGM